MVVVDLEVDDGVVIDFVYDVKVCVFGQVLVLIMVWYVVGVIVDELRILQGIMCVMLKEGGELLEGWFEDLKFFELVWEYKVWYVFILLMFDVVVDVFNQIDVVFDKVDGVVV